MSKHKWSFCPMCRDWMILCGTCGNNTCNGGSGEVNGKPCPDCGDAYDYDRKHHTFVADYRKWCEGIDKGWFTHDDEHPVPRYKDYFPEYRDIWDELKEQSLQSKEEQDVLMMQMERYQKQSLQSKEEEKEKGSL